MNKIRNNAGIVVVFLLVAFVGTFLATSLFKGGNNDSGPVFKEEGKLWFLTSTGDTITSISIEVADNMDEITMGLMNRQAMDENQGMLFIFPDEKPRSFWMKNTILPLDIIFADTQGVIGSSQNYTTPYSEASLPSEKPAKHVVEVKAGFWDKFKLKTGDKIVFQEINQ